MSVGHKVCRCLVASNINKTSGSTWAPGRIQPSRHGRACRCGAGGFGSRQPGIEPWRGQGGEQEKEGQEEEDTRRDKRGEGCRRERPWPVAAAQIRRQEQEKEEGWPEEQGNLRTDELSVPGCPCCLPTLARTLPVIHCSGAHQPLVLFLLFVCFFALIAWLWLAGWRVCGCRIVGPKPAHRTRFPPWGQMRALAARLVIRIDADLKRSYCKKCHLLLFSGQTCTVRVKRARRFFACFDC